MKPPRSSIRPRGVGPRPGTPKSVRTEGARLIARLRAKAGKTVTTPNEPIDTNAPLMRIETGTSYTFDPPLTFAQFDRYWRKRK